MHEHLREWKKVFAFLPTTVSNSYEKGKECVCGLNTMKKDMLKSKAIP